MDRSISSLTGKNNYFEHFTVGDVIAHGRGKTMTEMDNVMLTNMVMNTADGHFDEHKMKDTMFGQRITYGGITAALVIGLTSQDTAENALAELSLDKIQFKQPVFHGDTLRAYTEVLAVDESDQEDAGIVHFKHWGLNQDKKVVFEGERRVLIKKLSHWGDK